MGKYYEMNIVGCIRRLPIVRIEDNLDIASFVLLGDAELVVKAAQVMDGKLPEADYLITAEAKGIPLVQELARLRGMKRYFVARKSVKPYMTDPFVTEVYSITTKKKQILCLSAMMTLVMGTWTSVNAQTQQLFDSGWQFTRNGKTIMVDLPHDWDIYDAPDPATGATGTGGGWFQGGKGEYRKKFKTPKGELVKLHFEGVYQRAEVYVNGQKAGQHAYGYTPFTIDVTPFLFKDKRGNIPI